MMSSPRMTLLAVKVMRYVKGETQAHCSLSSHTQSAPVLRGHLMIICQGKTALYYMHY